MPATHAFINAVGLVELVHCDGVRTPDELESIRAQITRALIELRQRNGAQLTPVETQAIEQGSHA